ncbi:hypothetical protein BABINDRAFT_30176 [Babjeviella inositovora NRRL Y-12698]|uniref:Chromosome transmission fidelity protein 8 n=1 Tax=Babjeviella inositovora NRRL Y-12698 TaxID=984486 RepID=A0A1E3QZD3_9ASCO|nr:uncharacterized protein BABINDRAFT_30176 [Babjeviella inositovora NRRL Y-12698]ODQ83030.1 hypothetical protein BABINDRAFT_30176 [Babjeviella inositovora NRRL Y-12698]
MPTIEIEYSQATQRLQSADSSGPAIISTPSGLAILEIQGELTLPSDVPLDEAEKAKYSLDSDGMDIVKFGKLELDGKNATLFIGQSQRLVGSLIKLDKPLGVMRFPETTETGNVPENYAVKFMDVITQKVIFKQRPLPIM